MRVRNDAALRGNGGASNRMVSEKGVRSQGSQTDPGTRRIVRLGIQERPRWRQSTHSALGPQREDGHHKRSVR